MITSTRLSLVKRPDVIYLAVICLVTLVFFTAFFNLGQPPFEDAAMLMRYAQHTAAGEGIVWNIGEQPVDGATDFLFMIVLAAVIKLGLSPTAAVNLLLISAHIITTLLIYFGTRQVFSVPRLLASTAALAFSIGPGLNYVAASFATPFFALFVTLAWLLALYYCFAKPTRSVALFLAITLLLMSLTRPEGVFLTIFILSSMIYLLGLRSSADALWYTFLIFATIGSVYFFWHWSYFGYPLPNPFYRKGGGTLYPNSLYVSLRNTLSLSLPWLLFWLLPHKNILIRRLKIASLIPILGFALIWVFLSSEMNFFRRFQYPILLLVLVIWPVMANPLYNYFRSNWRRPYLSTAIFFPTMLVLLFTVLQYTNHLSPRHRNLVSDGRYDLALDLAPYRSLNYTILTSEAGLLPFYSGWRAIDAWGLNDKHIAHEGIISQKYIEANRPAVILLHHTSSNNIQPPSFSWLPDMSAWPRTIQALEIYALNNNYTLAARWGTSPGDTHNYYVDPTIPDHNEFVRLIRDRQYIWYANGQDCINYQSTTN